jgi:hypothetical protein
MLRTLLGQHGELHAEYEKIRLLLSRLTRHQFGRRSEQLSDEQLQLGLEDLQQSIAENQAEQDAAEPARDPKPRPKRPAGCDNELWPTCADEFWPAPGQTTGPLRRHAAGA